MATGDIDGGASSAAAMGIEVVGVLPRRPPELRRSSLPNNPSLKNKRVPNKSRNNNNTAQLKAVDVQSQALRRNSSPRTPLDFDVMATSGDENDSKMTHSHVAYEIQHKTQAMRELDFLLGDGDDDDNDDESLRVGFVLDDEKEKRERRGRRPKKTRQGGGLFSCTPNNVIIDEAVEEGLFSCTVNDIDEAVEDLVTPFDHITDYFMTTDEAVEDLVTPFDHITEYFQCHGDSTKVDK